MPYKVGDLCTKYDLFLILGDHHSSLIAYLPPLAIVDSFIFYLRLFVSLKTR